MSIVRLVTPSRWLMINRKNLLQVILTGSNQKQTFSNLNATNDISYEHGAPNRVNIKYDPSTLGQLLERSTKKTPDKVLFIVHHQKLSKTYSQFNSDVDQLSKALYNIGCRRGDTVGIWAVNCYEWLLVQFATAKLGCVLVTVNPGYKERELVNCINLVRLKTIICSQKFKNSNYMRIIENVSPSVLTTARGHEVHPKELPSLQNLIVLDEENEIAPSNVMRFSELMMKGSTDSRALNEIISCTKEQTTFDDVINVQFTSGTTGLPKAAMLTHHNIVQNVNFMKPRMFEGYDDAAQQVDKPSPVICLPNPLYHCFGCVVGSTATIYNNGSMVLPGPVANATATLSAIEQYRCNYVYGTPTMWSDLLNVGVEKFNLTSLKRGVMSGAPCPPSLVNKVLQNIPSLENILIPYGSTELSPVVTMTSIDDDLVKQTQTVGRPLDYVEVKIINPQNGQVVPRGEKGEVCIRGHCTFSGYFDQPEQTREVIDNNFWYHTGDIGYLDQEGYLAISGRIKEMIIRGGENIYPREIEEFFLLHPLVEDVHVVGVPDERFGEELAAYVKLKSNSKPIKEEEMKAYLKPKMSHFKIPKYIRFVDDFPRTITGKVQKVELKKIATKELIDLN